jgi:hypothetical protein
LRARQVQLVQREPQAQPEPLDRKARRALLEQQAQPAQLDRKARLESLAQREQLDQPGRKVLPAPVLSHSMVRAPYSQLDLSAWVLIRRAARPSWTSPALQRVC